MALFEEMKPGFTVPKHVQWQLKRGLYAFITRDVLDYETGEALMDEAEAWVRDQFPAVQRTHQRLFERYQVRFFFADSRMATAFKLRWC